MTEMLQSLVAHGLHPAFLLVFGGLLVPVLPRSVRPWFMKLLPIFSLALVLALPRPWHGFTFNWMGADFCLMRLDHLSFLWTVIFHIAAFLCVLYSLHVDDRTQHCAGLVYAGAAVGAVLAGDLGSLFIWWELTAVASVFLIWARKTERAYRVGIRYLIVQVGSGVLLLAGAAWHFQETGSIAFNAFDVKTPAGLLIFLAFGIKAAFPLLHAWLEDAYPEATITGTVILSAFTTKLAIYALARGFAGTDILIPIGAVMTAFPIFYAVIENDLRRVLTYSLNNQLGYMVVAIGVGSELALNGAAGHAFAHIIYKALLFMTMGAVLMRTGTINGSELGGLYKSMPWTTLFCCIGAASISAFPLFSGFVTKSMILTAVAEDHHTVVFLVLLFASAGVFHHSGIKIPFFAFFAHDRGIRVKEAPANMLWAMGLAAALCIGIGVWWQPLYAILPFPDVAAKYHAYDVTHVVTQLQLLLFSALAFTVLMRTGIYPPELRSTNLDVDWFYRKPAYALWQGTLQRLDRMRLYGSFAVTVSGKGLVRRLFDLLGPYGKLARSQGASSMTFWVAVMLALVLLLYYL